MSTTRRGFIAAAGGFLAGLCGLRGSEIVAEEEEQWVDLEGFEGSHCSCCAPCPTDYIITISLEGDNGHWAWNHDTNHWDRIEHGAVVFRGAEIVLPDLESCDRVLCFRTDEVIQ